MPSLHPVGSGATAKIFTGQVAGRDGPLLVAVKVFGNMLEDHHQEVLIRELRAARQVSLRGHPSILPFIGSASFGLQTAIVSVYMRNGNLLEYLRAHQGVDKKKLILQVAEAVTYLHTVELLVHGDLKCANVLVSDYGDAQVADFGLSTFVEKVQTSATTATNVRQMYTVRFAAPEILRDVAGHPFRVRSKTRESDVYAFGMLVLEAITERPPWAGCENFAVMNRVCAGQQPSRPVTGFSQAWWDVCRSCWTLRPENRPAMQLVTSTLKAHRHELDTTEIPADPPAWMSGASHPLPQPAQMVPQAAFQETAMPSYFIGHHEDGHEASRSASATNEPVLRAWSPKLLPPQEYSPIDYPLPPTVYPPEESHEFESVWTPSVSAAPLEDSATWTIWTPTFMPPPESLPEVVAPRLLRPGEQVSEESEQDIATWTPNPRWMPSPVSKTRHLLPENPVAGPFGPRELPGDNDRSRMTPAAGLFGPREHQADADPNRTAPGLFGPRRR